MKKILTFLLMVGMALQLGIIVHGAPETIDYTITFYDNKRWDIDDGVFIDDNNYWATNRIRIYENEITLNNLNFHHILFWDHTGDYLGYMNPSGGGYEGVNYLDDTDETVVLPSNATWFALTSYELAPNDKPITDLGNGTLNERFEDTTNTLGTPLSSSQLVTNGDFSVDANSDSRPDNWVAGDWTKWSYTSNQLVFLGATTTAAMYQSINYTGKMYLSYTLIRANSPQVGIYDGNGYVVNFKTLTSDYNSEIFTTTNATRIGIYIAGNTGANTRYVNAYLFNLSTLISNKLYSPMFNTTFDLMTDANIKMQMDAWVQSGLSTIIYAGRIDLGGGVYATPYAAQIEWMLDNDAYNLEAVSVLHNYGYTPLQTYYPQYIQNINDGWSTGLTALLFYSIEAIYDREEVVNEGQSFIELLTDKLDSLGLGLFPHVAVSIAVMIGLGIVLVVFKIPMIIVMIAEIMAFILFALIGWFPSWLVLIFAITLLASVIIMIKGGSSE